MTERSNKTKGPTMKENHGCSWKANLLFVVLGAVAQTIAEAPMQKAKDWAVEAVYHGKLKFAEAMALRRSAITENSGAKHAAANAALERARDAGVPEAIAQLGIAHCLGLGLPRSPRKGHSMLLEAAKLDGRLTIYLADSDICPQDQGTTK